MTSLQAPARQLRWELTGAGLNNLSLAERDVPHPGPGELLVRIDACGICFSDIKILNLGPDHPRLQGRDLRQDPVIMGHETAMTVLEVGNEIRDRFQPGQRFLIQADVYHGGQGMAFGYRLPGGYSQYQIIGHEILNGDEGCYLLPVTEKVSHAQAALCEPWACVEAAYRYRPRREPKPNGPALIFLVDTGQITAMPDELSHLAHVTVVTDVDDPWIHDPELAEDGVERLRKQCPEGYFDVLFYGMPNRQLARHAASLLRPGGVLAIQGRGALGPIAVDIGSIHYRDHWYTGAPQGDAYRWGRTTELTPGGFAWFIGAGGPLGQMHLQRALSLPRPPAKILVSQNGGPRLEDLRERFSGLAAERDVEFLLLDAKALGDQVYDVVRRETDGRGCDDICVIIPSPEVVERAFHLLAHGGGMDIFAGVAVGTTARLDLGRVASEGVRLWGTSGSSIADLRQIVDKVESGSLPTDRIVAAVGGIEAVKEGLAAVKEGIYPGKTLIYPHCKELPLLTIAELAERHPSVRALLDRGRYWTPEAEGELLRLYGAAGE
ncbi:MAG TPA: alcohol dehydrogenase catalytic domain-containing protein [Armatimonadota bacterium]|nr:alcohol dehydrogenase catalytic domain-containing protein [Armatimonadota bacterium]